MNRTLSIVALLAATLAPASAFGQAQTLYFEDFESGIPPTWTFIGDPPPSYWHWSGPGECAVAAGSHMLAYNRFVAAGLCDYQFPPGNHGAASGPAVALTGQAPYTASFDYIIKIHDGHSCWFEAKNVTTGVTKVLASTGSGLIANPLGDLLHFSTVLPASTFHPGDTIYFRFRLESNGVNLPTDFGFMVDEVRLKNSGPPTFTDLGSGLAGLNGIPLLAGSGTLAAGSSGSLLLSSAKASSPVLLFVALSSVPAPFKGGVLVANPSTLLVTLATDGSGALLLPFVWPSGVPVGTSLYFQYAIQDAAGPHGASLSNALQGVTP